MTTRPNASSYACVAAGAATSSVPIPATRHAVEIIPAKADAKVDREKVMKSLEPALRKAKVSGVRQLGDHGYLIESPSVLDVSMITDSAPLKEAGYTVGDPIKPAPKMLIYDLASGLSDAEQVSELY